MLTEPYSRFCADVDATGIIRYECHLLVATIDRVQCRPQRNYEIAEFLICCIFSIVASTMYYNH